jgi:hypothetical protein
MWNSTFFIEYGTYALYKITILFIKVLAVVSGFWRSLLIGGVGAARRRHRQNMIEKTS